MAATDLQPRHDPLRQQTGLPHASNQRGKHHRSVGGDLAGRSAQYRWALFQYPCVDVDCCEELHSDTVGYIITHCQRLKRLCFRRFLNLTDSLVADVVSKLIKLEYLNLSKFKNHLRLVLLADQSFSDPDRQPASQAQGDLPLQVPAHRR